MPSFNFTFGFDLSDWEGEYHQAAIEYGQAWDEFGSDFDRFNEWVESWLDKYFELEEFPELEQALGR